MGLKSGSKTCLRFVPIVCSRSVLPSRLSSRFQVVGVWVLQLEGEGYRLRRVGSRSCN